MIAERTDSTPASSLFRNRNFVLLFAAYGISAFGDHLSEVALLKMQDALDPSVTDVTSRQAVMTFVFFIPFFALGPLFGWLADRLPRKWLMIFADVIRAAIIFEVFVLLLRLEAWWTPGRGPGAPISIGVAVLPLLMMGLFAAMFSPARLALLPTIIRTDQITRANAATAGLGMIASIGSFVIGGWLVDHYSPQANFRLDALTFLLSALCVLWIRPPANLHRRSRSTQGLRAVVEGFRYVASHRRVAEVILISAVLWIGASVFRSVIPAIVKDVLGGTYQQIGYFTGLLGVGLVVGSVILTIFGGALRSDLAISWSLKFAGVSGLFIAAGVYARWSAWAVGVGVFLIGMFGAGVQVSVNSLLQRITPNIFRGRVFGVHDFCSIFGLLLATGVLGIPKWPHIDRHITWIAAVTSSLLFAAGMWTTLLRLRRGRFGRAITFWKNLNEFYCRLVPRVQRDGICTIPPSGPVIVAANHRSALDPFVLAATTPNRYLGFMIAREFAHIPFFERLVKMVECVPVNRVGSDIASVKAALRHLERGRCLGIFPEGRIRFDEDPLKVRDGVGMLALKSGATVIPAYVSGLRKSKSVVWPFLRRHAARVRYGPPVDLSAWRGREKDRAAHREAAELIMRRIEQLAPGASPPVASVAEVST